MSSKAAKASAPAKRKDPLRRHHDGGRNFTSLMNADPKRHYVWVSKTGDIDVDYYLERGYVIEKRSEGGVRPRVAGMRGDSSDIFETRGHVLMSCSQERHREILQHGDDGETGWDLHDAIEERLLDKRGADPIRGHRREVLIGIENDIQPTQVLGDGIDF